MASDATLRWPLDTADDTADTADTADSNDADAPDDDEDDAPLYIIRERIGPVRPGVVGDQPRKLRLSWERRLSARAKFWRGTLTTLTVALLAFLALGGPAAAAQAFTAWRQARVPVAHANPFPTFDDARFAYSPPPIGGAHTLTLDVAPGAANAWTAFACWLPAPSLATRDVSALPLSLAYHPYKQNNLWRPLPTPANINPTTCAVYPDAVNPQGLLLDIGAPPSSAPCALTTLFATSDLGAHWRRLAWPEPAQPACGQHEALLGGRVYAWANSSLAPPSQRHTPNDGRIITADVADAGAGVWTQADVGLGDLAALSVIGERPGGGLLALGDVTANGQTRMLLASQNNGASWRREGDLPGAFPQVYASSNPADVAHGGWGRLYELAQSEASGPSDEPAQQSLATAYLGDSWAPLPLPPLTASLPAGSLFRNTVVVGVTTGDALLVLRGAYYWNDNAAVPAQPLWLWDTVHARWLADSDLAPENVIALRLAWSQGQATLWVVAARLSPQPTIALLIATFARPPAAGANQSVAGG